MIDETILILYLTEECDKYCSYCENFTNNPRKFNKNLINDTINKFLCYDIQKIIINGGEPGILFKKDLLKIIKKFTSFSNLKEVNFLTNGLLVKNHLDIIKSNKNISLKWHCISVNNFNDIISIYPEFDGILAVVIHTIKDIELIKYISKYKNINNCNFTLTWVFSYHNRMKINIEENLYNEWYSLLHDKNIYFYNFDLYGEDILNKNYTLDKLNRKLKMDELIHKNRKELKGYCYDI